MADNKCNDHWYKSKEDLDKNGDCPYNHDENGNPVKADPYISKLVNQELKKVDDKQKSDENWIEERLKKIMPKEKDLQDISKVMLAHHIVCLQDALDDATDERDILYKENERLTEENSNLETLLKARKQNEETFHK